MVKKNKVSLIVALATVILLVTVFGLCISLYQVVEGVINYGRELYGQKIFLLMMYETLSVLTLLALNIFLLILLIKQKEKFRNYFILFSVLYICLYIGEYYLAKEYLWNIYEISLEFRNVALAAIRNAAKMALYSFVIIVGLFWSKRAKEFFAK